MLKGFFFINLITLACLVSGFAYAQTEPPQFMTVDGRLYDSNAPEDPLLDNSVLMQIQVLNPAKTCILYEEAQTVSTLSSNGYFNVRVGSPTSGGDSLKRTTNDSGNSMMQVFQNQAAVIAGRTSGGAGCSFTPSAGESRHFRFTVTPSTTGVTSTLSPDMAIDSVPQSLVAETLQGMTPTNFVQTNTDVTQAKVNSLFGASYTGLSGLLAGSSSLYLQNTTNGTVIPSRATNPVTPAAGQIWYDSDDFVLRYYDGTVVQTLSSGSADPTKLPLAGGIMAGAIDMGTNDITDIGHMTQAPQRTFRFGVYTTAQQGTLVATPLVAGHEGTVWYNTTTNKLMFWDGTAEYAVSPVDSVFGRTGAVVAAVSDYDAVQIDNTAVGNIAATNVQAAVDELDSEKVAKAGDTMTGQLNMGPKGVATGDGGAVAFTELAAGGVNAATIRAPDALVANYVLTLPADDGDNGQVLQTDGNGLLAWVTPASVGEVNTASNQGAGGVGVYDAKSGVDLQFRNINAASNKVSVALDAANKEVDINVNEVNFNLGTIPNTAAGDIAATNAQAAINELDSEKVASTRAVNTAAGSGLSGGGDLSADRSLSVNINGTTAETAVAGLDEILIYDISATALRKMTRTNFVLSETEVDAMVSNNGYLTTEADTLATVTGRGATTATNITLNTQAQTRYADSAGGEYAAIQAPATIATNYVLTLPTTAGTANQVLSTDGTGVLSWMAIPSAPVSSVFGRTGVVVAATSDYDAIQVDNTAAGNIAATDVQAALNELDTEKTAITRAINTAAGSGLSGGGDLSVDRSLSVNINGTTAETVVAGADEILIYDASATVLRKITRTNFVLSETEVDAMVSNNGYLTAEADTLATVTGRGASTATNITLNTQAQTRYADSAGGEYAAIQAPATIGANYVLTLPADDGVANQVLTTDGAGILTWTTPASAGEVNTASNQGIGGVGLYDTKSGVDLQFRNINAASNKVSVALDAANKEVDINVNEANFNLGTIPNTAAGTIAATNAQAAINELDSEKVASIRAVNTAAGSGLSGGGDLSADRSLSVNITGTTAETVAAVNDEILIYDTSATALRKMARSDFLTGYLTAEADTLATVTGRGATTATSITLNTQAQARFADSAGGEYAAIQAPATIATNYVLILPTTAGTANQVLSTDGTGVLSWVAIPSAPVTSVFGRTGVVVAATSDYDAIQVDNTAAGNIAATDVQAALNELDTEKTAITRAINTAAGSGLSGGGDLSADRSLSVNINGTTTETVVAGADEILIYDASATALRKITRTNFVLSETEVDAMVSNNGYLTAEADTLATVTGRGASTATNITLNTQAQTRYADSAGGEYAAIQAPATIGANYVLTLPADDGVANQVLTTDGAGVLTWTTPASAGEVNTASNQGIGGVGLYDAKLGVDLQFRNINAASNKVSVALDAANKEVDINVNEANFNLGTIPNTAAGTIAATNAQAAINELDSEKVASTRAVNTAAGSGLSGGGDLSADRSLSVNINGTTAETTAAGVDELLIYDTSATALRKMTRSDFLTGYLTAEADTLATVTGRGASTATSITLNTQAQARFADSAGGEYAAIQAPATIATNYVLTLPTTAGTANQVLSTDGTGVLSWVAIPSAPVSSVFGRTGVIVAATSDYDAVQVDNTAAGNIAATDVQAALNELDTEKTAITRAINTAAGSGLSGGGDLSVDRSLSVNINGTTAETVVAGADEILIYDASATVLRKITRTNFVLSETEVDAMVSNNGYLTAEADTLATVTGRGASTATNITLNTQAQTRYADSAGGEYAAIQSPATIATNYVLTLPTTAGTVNQVLTTDGTGLLSWTTPASAGEVNTASNQGIGGIGLYDAKSGVDLQFRNINAASNKVTVALDAANKEVDINVNEANFALGTIPNTAAGNIAATNAQAAINELDTEKVASTRAVNTVAGSGLSGGGDLSADRSLSVNINGTTAETVAAANDEILIYDTSATTLRKMTRSDFLTGYLTAEVDTLATVTGRGASTATSITLDTQAQARFADSVGGEYAAIQAPATIATNYVLTLPTTAGTANQVLSTDGTGVLSWVAIPSAPVTSVFGRTGVVVAATSDYDAIQVDNTAAGNIAATDVQAALNELDTEKTAITRAINTAAGSGLSGGGDLSADRSLSININGTTAETVVAGADEILIYDASATALRKITRTNFVLSETEVDAMVSNNGYLTAEADTLATVTGRGASTATNITLNTQAQTRYADSAGGEYAAIQAPATIGANYVLTLPADDGVANQVLTTDGAGVLTWTTPASAGEVNTASNQGIGGVGLYDTKSGVDLQFRNINAASNKVSVALDAANKEVDINVNEANFNLGTIPNTAAGTIAATNAQAAINELDSEKVASIRAVNTAAGSGLSGGGDLSADRSLSVNITGTTAETVAAVNDEILIYDTSATALRKMARSDFLTGYLTAEADTLASVTGRGATTATSITLNTQAQARFADSAGGEYAAIQAPATIATNYVLTLPTTAGTANQVLSTDGTGVLSWMAIPSAPVTSVFGRTGVVVAATSDYDAIQVDNTAAGNIAATDVQAAINELDTEKAATTRAINTAAGSGLSGGGDLSADRSLSVNINGTTAETVVAGADEILIYDASATALRKITRTNFVLSETEVDAMVSNNGYLTTEADTLATVTGRGASTATSITLNTQAQARFADSAGGEYAAIQAPTTIGANYVLTLPDTDGVANQVLTTDGSGILTWTTPASAGEVNTASNQGIGGVGLYDAKLGVDLQFRNINAASNKISVALDAANKEVDINVNEANFNSATIPNTAAGNIAATNVQGAINELDTEKVSKAGDTMTGQLNMGPKGVAAGDGGAVAFTELATGGTNTAIVRAPDALGANYVLTLPLNDGDSGQYLQTDGNGMLAWVTPAGVGETNTASNQGIGGVGVFKQKTTFDLEFRSINAASNKISVALDAANNEIDINVAEANFALGSIPNTPAGTIAATNAQAAINELDTEKVASTRAINTAAGSGLSGGGDLSADRSLSVNINGTTAETVAAANDEILIYDTSATALRKMARSDFLTGYLTAETDTLASVTGRGATTATSITLNTQAQARFADSAGGEYAAIQAPATIATNYVLTLPDSAGTSGQVLSSNGSGVLSWVNQSSVADDSLNFDKFSDAMSLDASTDIAATGTNVLSITNTGTGNSFLVNDEAGDTSPFVIDTSGNVGIGTSAPLTALDISGALYFRGAPGNRSMTFGVNQTSLPGNAGMYTNSGDGFWGAGSLKSDLGIFPNDGNRLFFLTGSGAGRSSRVAILPDGKVGIGTTVPGTILDAAGAITSRPSGTGTGQTGQLLMRELAASPGGTDTVTLRAPDSVGTSYALTLPTTAGTANQVLSTDGAGLLSWVAIPSAPVTSVFGRTGVVVAATSDYDAIQVDNTAAGTIAATNVQAAIDELDVEKTATTRAINTAAGSGLSGGGDLSADRSLSVNITGTTAETVAAANDEILIYDTSATALRKMARSDFLTGYLTAEADSLATVTGRGASTATSITLNTQAQARFADAAGGEYAAIQSPATITTNYVLTLPTTAGTANQVLSTDGTGILSWVAIPSAPVTSVFGRTGVVVAATSDYDAIQVDNTAAGTIAATNVQAALNELDTEKTAITRAVNTAAGSGLSGGGDLSADRSLSVNINGTTVETVVAGADEILIYDASATVLRKMTRTNFVLSETEVDTMVSNNGYLTAEADTLATITGRGASTATSITLNTQAQARFADASGGEYAAIQSPATITTNYVLTLPTTAGTANQILTTDGTGLLSWTSPASAGEVNTASNQGVAGVGLFDAKSGVDLQFRNINAASNKVSVALDAANKEVDINVNEANFALGTIPNTATGNIAATNAQAAINELDTEKVAKAGDTMTGQLNMGPKGTVAGDGGAIAFTELATNGTNIATIRSPDALLANYVLTLPTTAGTANQVLSTDGTGILSWVAIPSAPVTSVFGRTGVVIAATSDYDAIQVDNTAAGTIAATNVQAALNELDTEKTATTRAINTAAGSGLSGGGDLSADRSLSVNITGTTAETVAAANDEILIYDTSATVLRKMARSDFLTGYLTAEADTLATVTGRGASTATSITLNTQAQARFADAAGGEYAAIQSPATITTNYVLTLPTTAGTANQVLTTDGTGLLSWTTPASAGEVNTASNQGVAGVGLYDAKSGVDLQFRNINAASNKVSVALDAANKEVDINVNEANFALGTIPNTAAGNIAATNAQAAINELDSEKVAKAGDTMTGQLNMGPKGTVAGDGGAIAFTELAANGVNIATIRSPDALAANYVLTLPTTTGTANQVLTTDGAGILTWTTPASGVAADSLNFTDFADAMTLDASTDIAVSGTNVLSVTNTGTGNSLVVNDLASDTSPFVIDASGNVGIGTITPLTLNGNAVSGLGLHTLNASGAATNIIDGSTLGHLILNHSAAGVNQKGWRLSSQSGNFQIGAMNDVGTMKSFPLAIDTNGNVGIGTTVPGTILDAAGAITSRPNGTGTGQTGQLIMRELAVGGTETATIRAPDAITTSYVLTLPTTAGTANQVLTTDGAGLLSWTTPASGVGADSLNFTDFADALTLDASTDIAVSGTNVLSVTNGGTGNSFVVNDVASDTSPFVIDASGNVGIGTTAPTDALHVNGTARVNTLNVMGNGNQAYVFSSATEFDPIQSGTAGSLITSYNTSAADSSGAYGQYMVRNTAGNVQRSYIGAVSNTGAGVYTPTIVFGQQTGATAYAERMRIDPSGNLGIGTSVPGTILDAAGAITSRPNGTGTGQTGQLIMRELAVGGTDTVAIRAPDAIGTSYSLTLPATAGAANQVLTTDGAGLLSWTASGAASIADDSLNFDKLSDTMTLDASTEIAASGTNVLSITNTGTGDSFRVNDQATDTTPFIIDASGQVGIGTTVPSTALHVAGEITATAVSASSQLGSAGNNGSAYVSSGTGTHPLAGSSLAGRVSLSNYSSTTNTGPYLLMSSRNNNGDGQISYIGSFSTGAASTYTPYMIFGQQTGANAYAERMRIDSTGYVGIGTTSPRGLLDVNGTIVMKPSTSNAGTTIDFGTGNLQHTALDCQAFILHNMKDGGSYTLAVKGTTVATCSFTAFSDAGGSQYAAPNVHMPVDHAATTTGKHTLYTFLVMGGDVYITWMPGL